MSYVKRENGLQNNSNQWRKSSVTLSRQLQKNTNPNFTSNNTRSKGSNQQYALHYRHQHHRSNQWRNPIGNNKGRNSNVNSSENKFKYEHGNGRKRYNHRFDPDKWLDDQAKHEELTASLHYILQLHGVFEHGEGSEKRCTVLNHLEQLLNIWSNSLRSDEVRICAEERIDTDSDRSSNEDSIDNANTSAGPQRSQIRLVSFGSYRLGVHAPDADLDLLALCPPHVTREEFFSSFVQKLKDDERCDSIHPIPGAYTPVIKFNMNGIPIDMLFVKLVDGKGLRSEKINAPAQDAYNCLGFDSDSSAEQRRTEFQIEDGMLNGLDEPSSRSLNGVRVAQYLLDIIPNRKSFRLVLKTVKEWAQVHGLYSNVLGFLGGINWAILVAWVCKRYPEQSPPVLMKIFFHTFSRWDWPKPVILTQILNNPPQGLSPLTVWNPAINPRDRAQVMPIITPCYPSMNSSYNVAQPQLRRLREELHRANNIMDKLASGGAQWSDLLKENDFFKDHVHYLQVSITAENEDDHRAWFGLCESRLRILIAGLDSVEYGTQAYPFAKYFTRKETQYLVQTQSPRSEGSLKEETSSIVTSLFIALRFAYGIENVDLINCTAEYSYAVNSWNDRRRGMDLDIGHVLQKDLPGFVFNNSSSNTKQSIDMQGDGICSEENSLHVPGKKELRKQVQGRTVLNNSESPDDCLASPMKRAKISKA